MTSTAETTVVGSRYAERLWPSAWVVASLLALAGTFAVALLPAAGPAGVAAGAAGGAVAVGALVLWWTPQVRVVDVARGAETGGRQVETWLQAGSARIPVSALGTAEARRDDAWRAELGPALDARSYRCVRGWVRHGVRVAVADARDPVPYWLVSSRRPESLAAAVEQAGADAAGTPGHDGTGTSRGSS